MNGHDRVPDAVPVLPVADLTRALAFYERLGFEVRTSFDAYAILGYGPTEVHLAEAPEVADAETWTGAYLRVADVDAVHAHWTAVGARELRPVTDEPYGMREFATEDLDGNLWRVSSPIAGVDADPGDGADPDDAGLPEADDDRRGGGDRRSGDDRRTADLPTDGRPGTTDEAWLALVADGARCAGCGLTNGELHERAIGAEVRDLAHAFGELLLAADDAAVRTRPDPGTWSALEYGVHTRDVINVFAERIVRTLAEIDPVLGWWDHEAAIADGMANESDVAAVADDLGRNASKLSEALRLVDEDDWGRGAVRREGERFTIVLMARFVLHEVVHHRTDAERSLAAASG